MTHSTVRHDVSVPATSFTMVPNHVIRDPRLSPKARLLWIYLLSHRDGWELSVARIAEDNGISKDAVSSGTKELRAAGYLRMNRITDARGHVVTWEYIVCDPGPGNPDQENPDTGNPDTENQDAKENQSSKDQRKENQPLVSRRSTAGSAAKGRKPQAKKFTDYTPEFEAWYSAYPRHVAKRPAFLAFVEAIKRVGLEELMAATRSYAEVRKGQPADKTPHPASWLNADRWLDDTSDAGGPASNSIDWDNL
ncbi:RepA-like replication initiator [Gordonia phage Aleemily]|uniref:RepA-like replication initiator n=1 Tax=Gordonia phage Aleemily TaxID=2965181 RepID=A0A9E7TYB1_9CAUD|nr:RepA-like replication initiator [Gordonia phage Aleemily]